VFIWATNEYIEKNQIWMRDMTSKYAIRTIQYWPITVMFFLGFFLCHDSLMFWTDWGINAKIEKASLSGGQRVAIVTTYLYYPNGIELDRGSKRIFWVDAGYERVESADYNGNNRKLLYYPSGLHPFGLALIPPFLFFTNWYAAEDIHQLDATTGNEVRKYSVNGGQPMGIVAYDASRQPAGI